MSNNNDEKKLYLLDAFALIFRSYFAFAKNPIINSKGQNTSAILGFVNTLNLLMKKTNIVSLKNAFEKIFTEAPAPLLMPTKPPIFEP